MIRFLTMIFAAALLWACNQQPTPAPLVDAPAPKVAIHILAADDFEAALKASLNHALLDLRPAADYECARLYKSVTMPCPDGNCDALWQGLGRESHLFLYCANGYASTKTAKKMEEAGFSNICVLQGGIIAWTTAGKMLTKL